MIQRMEKGTCLREAGVDQDQDMCLTHNTGRQEGTLGGLHDRLSALIDK